ncbi:tRNA dimethylallyltransferase [Drechslerella dactyloides]|uniref:tRNA dimethylallyltransferase n=1 Tax=Drechslerella dactyloides TaxID=74499 RepID=A0AAD6IWE9_DREDA|nr:tRNA dimethylallyltransferase [Drechslerella dactyloides]
MQQALRPLITVIGATGTGKSKLAVDLAIALNGEIVNSDAMQMYRGMDVITNKHPIGERMGVPHHLMDFLNPEEAWKIGQWLSVALKTIEDIRNRGKVPIVVGGTHYYVQSLLFRESLQEFEEKLDSGEYSSHREAMVAKFPILEAPTSEILEELRRRDPVMANRWHPNDRRKILRSLEICLTTNQKVSDLYAETAAKNSEVSTARFSNLLFWVHASDDVLASRLKGRVDQMIDQGLFNEIDEMFRVYKDKQDEIDPESGIWQSIGWKQFLPYLIARDAFGSIPSTTPEAAHEAEVEISQLRAEGIEKTNIATRHYSKSQLRWIRIKLLNRLLTDKSSLPGGGVYLLDTSDLAQWGEMVRDPAIKISKEFLDPNIPNERLPKPTDVTTLPADLLTPYKKDLSTDRSLWLNHTCEHCHVTAVTKELWEKHLNGKAHKQVVKRKLKKEHIALLKTLKAASERRPPLESLDDSLFDTALFDEAEPA